jgi:PST family polysaccharide transporter
MSKESNKFNTSHVEVAEVASVAAFPPYEVESWVDTAKGSAGRSGDFTTDHLLTNLKGRTVSSVFVTFAGQSAQFVLNVGSIMILARLLTPGDFGLVAMVTTIIGFFRIFNEAGLSTATVQCDGITHAQVSNLFWTNILVGGTISLILAVGAPVVASFYREPRLISITLALCITFLFTTAAVQHMAILKRQMRFKMIALIQVSSVAVGILTGIVMALLKFGYWSLVGIQITTPLIALLLTWTVSAWRPQLPRRGTGTRSLLNFGANLTASSFLWSLARGSDALLIGRVYGPSSIGLYSRAGALIFRPVEQLIGPVESVFVPMLSRLQTQPARYRRILLESYEVIAIASFLLAGLLFALANPLTLVVLGPNWEKAAAIVAGFTLVAAYSPISSVSTWLLTSQGRGRDFLRLSLVTSSVVLVSFVAGLPYGPTGVAISYSAACLLIVLPADHYIAGRQGPVTTRDLWSRFFTHLPLWGVVCVVTWLTRRLVENAAPIEQLLMCVPVGLLAGVAFICTYAPSRRAAISLVVILRELLEARGDRSSAE